MSFPESLDPFSSNELEGVRSDIKTFCVLSSTGGRLSAVGRPRKMLSDCDPLFEPLINDGSAARGMWMGVGVPMTRVVRLIDAGALGSARTSSGSFLPP